MTQREYTVAIRDALGQTMVHRLQEGETVIGSDSSADIRVHSERALSPRHILLVPRYEDCWVSAQAAPLRNEAGAVVDACFVPWGSRLLLGGTQFELHASVASASLETSSISGNRGGGGADTGRESGAAQRRVHPILLMLALSTMAFVAFTYATASAPAAEALPPAEANIFSAPAGCDSSNPLHRAQVAELSADAKRQRAVFDAQDGVAAVSLYEEAAACYQLAGKEQLSNECAHNARDLRESLLGDYKRIRLRLERALEAGDNDLASEQVARLQVLLRHQKDSATSHALRRLALRLSRKN